MLLLLILPHPESVPVMIWVTDMFGRVGQDMQDFYLLQGNGPVILIPTHRHHCIPVDNLSCAHTTHGDAYMELSTSIAVVGLLHTHPYTPLYKVDVRKDEVEDRSCCVLKFALKWCGKLLACDTEHPGICSWGVQLYEHIPNGSC